MIRRLLRYRDRDDMVDIAVVPARHGRWIWVARDAPPDEGTVEAEPVDRPARAVCPFPGHPTEEAAFADAVSLLNVVGEDDPRREPAPVPHRYTPPPFTLPAPRNA